MSVRILVALLLLNAGTGTSLGAQSHAKAYVDLTVGTNLSIGRLPISGEYYERAHGFALLAFGNQPDANRPLIAALHVGLFVMLGGDDQCDRTPLGGCWQDFPFGPIIAITVGGRPVKSVWRAFEVTAGPALVGLSPSGMSFGVLAVGRFGVPPGWYLSPGLAVHVLAAPVGGAFAFATGLGLSLRTW